ncbi:unnamed protein product, partial [Rotaria sp. Silwood1]
MIGSFGSSNTQLSSPINVAVDSSSGAIYIADSGNHRIMCYQANASSGTVVAGGNGAGTSNTQLNNPFGLYFDVSSNSLLIGNTDAHNVVRWTLGATHWTLVAGDISGSPGSSSTQLSRPAGLAVDWMGNLYVADGDNHRIQFFLAGESNGTTIAGVTATSG